MLPIKKPKLWPTLTLHIKKSLAIQKFMLKRLLDNPLRLGVYRAS